jgi:hypothetical protein
MNLDDLDQSMSTIIAEVQECVGLPTASVAALLRYFSWNKVRSKPGPGLPVFIIIIIIGIGGQLEGILVFGTHLFLLVLGRTARVAFKCGRQLMRTTTRNQPF